MPTHFYSESNWDSGEPGASLERERCDCWLIRRKRADREYANQTATAAPQQHEPLSSISALVCLPVVIKFSPHRWPHKWAVLCLSTRNNFTDGRSRTSLSFRRCWVQVQVDGNAKCCFVICCCLKVAIDARKLSHCKKGWTRGALPNMECHDWRWECWLEYGCRQCWKLTNKCERATNLLTETNKAANNKRHEQQWEEWRTQT